MMPPKLSRQSTSPSLRMSSVSILLTVLGTSLITVALLHDYSAASPSTILASLSAPLVATHYRSSSRIAPAMSSSKKTTTQITSTAPALTVTAATSGPPTKKQIGNAGWTLIHSIAANYPKQPTEKEQRHAMAFLRSMTKLYPCQRCKHHFHRFLATSPPDLSSREPFMLWACAAHNAVNKRQGKSQFPCNIASLERKWGDCGCALRK